MIALAGNYFTINTGTSNYTTYIDSTTNELKVKAATLGPVQITVTKECAISGDKNNATCKDELEKSLNNISSPTVEFGYESEFYNNPILDLNSTTVSDNKQVDNDIHSRTVIYNYILSDTYKYVSKNTGISYKDTSYIGKYPYVTIENHLPINFSKVNHTTDYQITIKKFNLPNFDKLILNGKTVSTRFTNNLETYVKTLIDSGQAYPRYINGIYYLDNTFIALLNKNGFTENELINSACGNTENYTCYSNENGIYCYDKNTTINSESTYVQFNACINNAAQNIKYQKENFKNDMLYICNFDVKSNLGGVDGKNIIYRPISLDNPFPSIDADGRVTGANWCYGNDCDNTNQVVTSVITNNRGVKTEEIYKERDPLYTINLTPGLIKEIREYNDKNPYDDFNLECGSNGLNCKSNFIRDEFKNYFSGCGIRNKNLGLECAETDEW